MKFYIIAGGLFALAFLVLGILTASIMSGPEPPNHPQAGAGGAQTASHGGGATYEPAAPVLPSAMPGAAGAGAAGPGAGGPGAASHMTPAAPPLPGMLPAANAPITPAPTPTPARPNPTVPIIQPTDLGSSTSPTAGRLHQ
jgi:hypothetical protein